LHRKIVLHQEGNSKGCFIKIRLLPLLTSAHRGTLNHLDRVNLMKTNPSRTGKQIPENLEELKAAKRRLLQETFGEMERSFLVKALRDSQGNITHAAARVGMQRSNFSSLMKKHRIFVKDIMAQG
jgi:two-component system NtrC family response regulator